MGKSDDSIRRRKNKKNRKKHENDSSNVSSRIASIIAAKKRRKSGKRRLCQGMCFSLPTPDDPFNDRHDKTDLVTKVKKPSLGKSGRQHVDEKFVTSRRDTIDRISAIVNVQEKNSEEPDKLSMPINPCALPNSDGLNNVVNQVKSTVTVLLDCQANGQEEFTGCPSKFLIHCLNTIQNALRHEEAFNSEEDSPLFVHKWGFEFWKIYSSGKDVLETSRANSTLQKIAWLASCAADTIAKKEKEGQSFSSPFLLYLVPSQEKASEVRRICKPLKALGIHSVSLHSGAPINHQIRGLRSCEPEFLLSTPERLLELISMKEVNISGVSLLVIDGLETRSIDDISDRIICVRKSISESPQTVVFSDGSNSSFINLFQNLLQESFCRIWPMKT